MATVNLKLTKLHFPNNGSLPAPITAAFYVRPYYPVNGSYTLLATGVPINTDGTITGSPPPLIPIDPTQKYMIKAVNESCGFVYEQAISVNPYCPIGFTLSDDKTYCFEVLISPATPPTNPQNTVAAPFQSYSTWGTLVYDPGYNINGVGSFTQIPYANPFWVNGIGYPNNVGTTPAGPMNRGALWAPVTTDNQTVGFAVCVDVPADGIYYVGMGADNIPKISVDGNPVIVMDPLALGMYMATHGYPFSGVIPNESSLRFWNVYPVMLLKGRRVLEMVCLNTTGPAAMAAEIYNCDYPTLAAAGSYGALGAALIFSTKDYIGQPVQVGSGGIGYSCPDGFSPSLCSSPVVCVKRITTPVLY